MRHTTRIRVSLDFAQQLEYQRRQMELATRKRMKMTDFTELLAMRKNYAVFHPFTPTLKAKEGIR